MTRELDVTATAADVRGEASTVRARPDNATDSGNSKVVARHGSERLAPGTRLDHFRIERLLGAGGMGEVYLATDLALSRQVAIKVLTAGTASGAARDRLVREACTQASIHHPNVAHIYFIGEDAGHLYFAMEYVAGQTLAELVAERPLSIEKALQLVHDAALGLRAAHRAGFTHRDVKPSNLMLDERGTVKVLDFGLVVGQPTSELHDDGSATQTTLGGTPLYMAPEQARGERVDLRADIYALGCTLYQLVSGRPPFEARSIEELASLHRTGERPRLSGRLARAATSGVDALVRRMMAPEPRDRIASYEELLRAIELLSTAFTRPAGLWVRAIANAIDVVVAQMIVVSLYHFLAPEENVALIEWFPTVALLQLPFLFAWSASPGMRLLELEVVEVATGAKPTWRALVARTICKFVLPIGAGLWAHFRNRLGVSGLLWGTPVAIGVFVPALALVHASLRVPGKRTPWDRIAGTLVRYRSVQRIGAS